MKSDRVCAKSGLLVNGTARLPSDDPCEYYDTRVPELVGCTRLRCTKCEASVRSGPPGLVPQEVPDVSRLYATADWSDVSLLRHVDSPKSPRLYACRCAWWVATQADFIENEHDSDSDPDVPWRCTGHPLPQLPITLGNLEIEASTDWPGLVDKVLHGSCPRRLQRENSVGDEPGVWLAWLYVYLRGHSVTDKLSSAVAERADDADPHVVGRVLYFFTVFPHAQGVERLIARAESDPHRVAIGYPIPEYKWSPTLFDVLASRLQERRTTRDELSSRTDAVVRKILLLPLSSLPHDDVGPTSLIEYERQNRARHGKDLENEGGKAHMRAFEELIRRDRSDVIVTALNRFNEAFDDMRQFIADHIVEIDAAAPGRWRTFMDLLSDWHQKPQTGHLIVIAGARVIKAGLTTPDEFRSWIKKRRAYGWVDDAWVLPLQSMLDED